MTAMNQIPDGYKADRRGRLVPVETIKPVDLLRDELVCKLITEAKAQRDALTAFKSRLFSEIEAFVDLSMQEYDIQHGGTKGNLSLYSFDGRYRIQIAISDRVILDERLQAAKHLIDECFREWTADSRPEIRAIIDNAFAVDKEGNLNTYRVLGLRKLDIKDDKWQMAMKAIAEAVTVVGSTSYGRLYERVGDTERYAPICLDFAGV